jgi:2-methylcitrate dehydratase PrpD
MLNETKTDQLRKLVIDHGLKDVVAALAALARLGRFSATETRQAVDQAMWEHNYHLLVDTHAALWEVRPAIEL